LTAADGTKCTYLGGNNCVAVGTCASFDGTSTAAKGPAAGSEEAECKGVKSTAGYPCIKDVAKKCKA